MKINFKRGFTLIELLVVVAIIGILASVVLASLNSARNKGGDAAIKSNLAGVRSQAELLFNEYGAYGVDGTPTPFALGQCANTADTLFVNTTIWNQIIAAYTASGGSGAVANSKCYGSTSAWAVAVTLKTSDGAGAGAPLPDSWCVDNLGSSKPYAWVAGQTISDSINATFCR